MSAPLDNLYNAFVELPSKENLVLLIGKTLEHLKTRLHQKRSKLYEGEVISETVIAIYNRVQKHTLPKIKNYSSYVSITAKNIIRRSYRESGIIPEKMGFDRGEEESFSDEVLEKLDRNIKLGAMYAYLKKVIIGVTANVFTTTEAEIITRCLRTHKAISKEGDVVEDCDKVAKTVRKGIRESLAIKGSNFCNHMKRIREKLGSVEEDFGYDNIYEALNFLIKEARKYKVMGLETKRKKNFTMAILCYEIVNFIEPKYWLKISSSSLKSMMPEFWEAKYNIGFCQMRMADFEGALKTYTDFVGTLSEIIGQSPDIKINVGKTECNKNAKYLSEIFGSGGEINLDAYFLSKSLNQIGNLYERVNNFEEAIAFFTRAATVNPNDLIFQVNLMTNYVQIGEEGLAREIFNKHSDDIWFKTLVRKSSDTFNLMRRFDWFNF